MFEDVAARDTSRKKNVSGKDEVRTAHISPETNTKTDTGQEDCAAVRHGQKPCNRSLDLPVLGALGAPKSTAEAQRESR